MGRLCDRTIVGKENIFIIEREKIVMSSQKASAGLNHMKRGERKLLELDWETRKRSVGKKVKLYFTLNEYIYLLSYYGLHTYRYTHCIIK